MRASRLPDGFGVRVDPRVRVLSGGRVLLGGSPTRMLTLSPKAVDMIDDGFLQVVDNQTAVLARRLLDSGVGHPRPTTMPSVSDVTVVVPVKDNPCGLERLLACLRGVDVVVVDDGSAAPVDLGDRPRTRVVRHDTPRGPAAARNTGWRVARTPFVAFLDSDVVPHLGWLELMAGHFSDPAVALVAPRIVALDAGRTALARYEIARSSLDLGRREAPVAAGGSVSYVPSAAMLVRRSALDAASGFDETLHVAEDVDLCRRLEAAGYRLRYEPVARVAHDHRIRFRDWFARKKFYGTGAALLDKRHPGTVPPVSMSVTTLVAAGAATFLGRRGLPVSIAAAVVAVVRLRRLFTELDRPSALAALFVAQSMFGGATQIASASTRHFWPITAVAMMFSRKLRRTVFVLAVADGLWDWFGHREPGGLDPLRYVIYRRLDDLAYGAGLWEGSVRHRHPGALRPRIVL